jgi:hypothetical protein
MKIQLAPEDVLRLRLGNELNPVWELQAAAHAPLIDVHPSYGRWVVATRRHLAGDFVPLVRTLRSGVVQVGALNTDSHGSGVPFDDQIEQALSKPLEAWTLLRDELEAVGVAIPPSLVTGRRPGLVALGSAARRYFQAALAPYWTDMTSAATAAVNEWSLTMSQAGVDDLLSSLHPSLTWSPPMLHVRRDTGPPCPLGCPHRQVTDSISLPGLLRADPAGLLITPSVFHQTCRLEVHADPHLGLVASALSVPVETWQPLLDDDTPPVPDPLAALMGATRSWVLLACLTAAVPTSTLAHRVGISVSSASERAAVLRASGLLRSTRVGNTVRHQATALGMAVAAGARVPHSVA